MVMVIVMEGIMGGRWWFVVKLEIKVQKNQSIDTVWFEKKRVNKISYCLNILNLNH